MISLNALLRKCFFSGFKNVVNEISRSSVLVSRTFCTRAGENANDVSKNVQPINKNFINRNPRNLEQMNISWKKKGWRFQYPTKEFYHRAVLEISNRKTETYLEHCSGKRVLACSTNEKCLRRHLYSATDVSAVMNVSRLFARRCLEAGVNQMLLLDWPTADQSEKFQVFKDALTEAGLNIQEEEQLEAPYMPGIDYEDPEKLEELRLRQYKVWCLGKKNLTMKHLNKKVGLKTRGRPLHGPKDLTMPSYEYSSG